MVEQFCKKCHECQLVEYPSCPEPMNRETLPERPWEDLAANLLGPMPTGEHLLIVVDYNSCYFEVSAMKTITSAGIIVDCRIGLEVNKPAAGVNTIV